MTTDLKQYVRAVPDFPKAGIVFRDIAPLLRTHFVETIDALSNLLSAAEWQNIDAIAGIESRGFIFASALAYKHQKGTVLIRKAGKLPHVAASASYTLEYGTATLEIQQGSGRLLLVDDVLATGGTLEAAATAATKAEYSVTHIMALINLPALNSFSFQGIAARCVMHY